MARILDVVERLGNRLPNPITLFVVLALGVLVASSVAARLDISVIHPRDGSTLVAVDLLTREGVRRAFTEAVKNFMGFAPLGTVLAAMIGIGVAEASGLIAVTLRAFVLAVPRRLLTATIVFAGIMANLAADAGLIVLPPVAGMLFAAVGRHPLAGIAAAFAGVAGGFSANLLPSTLDVLLAAFTQEAVTASKLLDAGYHVQVLGNYYFMAVSTPFLTVVGTVVTERIVEPRLGAYTGTTKGAVTLERLGPKERRGLIAAGIALLATFAAFALLTLPEGAPLNTEAASALDAYRPFLDSMVMVVLLVFLIPGLAYGLATGRIENDHDVAKMTGDTLATMGSYIVLAFAASQFIAYFAWSNLGAIIAISGANALRALGVEGPFLIAAFVLFAAGINLFMSSATAKWAILAPVFVPMFVLLGFTPEATQLVFRVGDSSTNIVTPLLPYLPIILGFCRKWDERAGTGSLIAMMLPYSIAFLIMWTSLLLLYWVAGWQIGPGAAIPLVR